jgi:hypothetical protein
MCDIPEEPLGLMTADFGSGEGGARRYFGEVLASFGLGYV